MEQNVINPELSLKANIDNRIRVAMKDQNRGLLTVLRAIKKAIVDEEKAEGASGELSAEATSKLLKKMMKQRVDSAALYMENKRPELAYVETYEATVIKEYAPKPLDEAATRALIEQLVADGATEVKTIMEYIKNNGIEADGRLASKIAAELVPKKEKKEKAK